MTKSVSDATFKNFTENKALQFHIAALILASFQQQNSEGKDKYCWCIQLPLLTGKIHSLDSTKDTEFSFSLSCPLCVCVHPRWIMLCIWHLKWLPAFLAIFKQYFTIPGYETLPSSQIVPGVLDGYCNVSFLFFSYKSFIFPIVQFLVWTFSWSLF